ncbi:hypothetical protein [Streptomyces beihaiensis]|uniref:Uncharacterized protein n=1 Tax=Streptomyces beihaiensis TaxID=2984495 RepID=A0ABT3U0P6_9ACTN|nr:hypothetical protein [Streptomyces beihaiensis]MCX3062876.1 hypothetical protein [Streptomyces beihaiensis]
MTTSHPANAAEALFDTARHAADAVLFEGYVLYPYRASAAKNRLRWQFGVLVPPRWDGVEGERGTQRTECLMEPRTGAELHVRVRFLRPQRRAVQRSAAPDGGGDRFETVETLELADRVLVPWDEGVEESVDVRVPVDELGPEPKEFPFSLAAADTTETVRDEHGRTVGRLVRRREEMSGRLRLAAAELPGPYRVMRLTALLENTTPVAAPPGARLAREDVLPHSMVSAHLMAGLTRGGFLSMTDPPQWASAAVAECRNEHTWPVLAGADRGSDVILSSPIILEDHPRIAPESPGALYDATEIDEILALRTATLTDDEKRQARGTDARAGAVIDLADSMPPEVLDRLHGAVRSLRDITHPPDPAPEYDVPRPEAPWWDPGADAGVDPGRDSVLVDGTAVAAGSRVRLRPGPRRTDAQDMFLHGRAALVEAVLHDVDGSVHLAVTLDDDPGAELARAQGRFRYFQPDEVAVLEEP